MTKHSLGAVVLAATPALAQQNTTSMTQEQIHSRLIELCSDPYFGQNLMNRKDDICEYSTDGGKTWILTGTGTLLSLLWLGYIFRLRQRKKAGKAFIDLNNKVARHDAELSADPFTPITEIPNIDNTEDVSTSTDVVPQYIEPIMAQEAPLQIGTSPLWIEYTDPLKLEYTPKEEDEGNTQDTSNV